MKERKRNLLYAARPVHCDYPVNIFITCTDSDENEIPEYCFMCEMKSGRVINDFCYDYDVACAMIQCFIDGDDYE